LRSNCIGVVASVAYAMLSLLTPVVSHASPTLFAGHRLGFQWYYSTLDHPHDPPAVIEVTPTGSFYIDHSQSTLTVSDNQIRFESSINFSTHFNGGPFNGFVLTDIDGTIGNLDSFVIESETNLAGFSDSRVTLSANSIAVNFQNLSNRPGMLVVLSVAGHSVPEPSPLTLAAAAAIAILLSRTTRRT